MPRNPKKKNKQMEDGQIKEALSKVREGKSIRQVATEYQMPKSTLHLYSKKSQAKAKKLVVARGRPPTLYANEEKQIIDNIKYAGDMGWPVHRDDIAKIIGNYCKLIGRKTAFKTDVHHVKNIAKTMKCISFTIFLHCSEKLSKKGLSTFMSQQQIRQVLKTGKSCIVGLLLTSSK